jgi:hypothetical protein
MVSRKSDVANNGMTGGGLGGAGGGGSCGRTPHLVMKKSPSPPLHYATPSPKNTSPVTPPTEDGMGKKLLRGSVTIQTNPICNTATYCELHGSTKCTHNRSSNHLVKRENSKSPRTSPQISPSTSTPANLGGSHETFNNNGRSTSNPLMTESVTAVVPLLPVLTTTPPTVGKTSTSSSLTSSPSRPGIHNQPQTGGNKSETDINNSAVNQKMTGGGQNDLGILHFRIRCVCIL